MEGWFESLTVGASKERNVPNARVATNLFADPWTSRLPCFRSGRLAMSWPLLPAQMLAIRHLLRELE